MENKNLFDYILYSNPKYRDILSLIKYNVINKIYYYGDHFKSSTPVPKYRFILNGILEYLYILFVNLTLKKADYH